MEIKDIKAELVNESSVTNQMIINGFLVGVLKDDGRGVHIVKNRINEVQGLVPISIWVQLVEDMDLLKTKLQKEADEIVKEEFDDMEEQVLDEVFGDMENLFDHIFGATGQSFEDIRPKYEEVVEKTENKVFNFIKSLEKVIQEIEPKVKEVKEQVIKEADKMAAKGISKAQVIRLQMQKVKLENLKKEAISNGVATKGFIKKIDEKINKINNIL